MISIIFNGDIMLMNNKFSTKNKLLHKMKCLNTRNQEYTSIENKEYNRIQKYNEKNK